MDHLKRSLHAQVRGAFGQRGILGTPIPGHVTDVPLAVLLIGPLHQLNREATAPAPPRR